MTIRATRHDQVKDEESEQEAEFVAGAEGLGLQSKGRTHHMRRRSGNETDIIIGTKRGNHLICKSLTDA